MGGMKEREAERERGWNGMRWDEMGCDGRRWDEMGGDGMRWDEMGRGNMLSPGWEEMR